jgi:hypothetical protein
VTTLAEEYASSRDAVESQLQDQAGAHA